MRPWATNHTYQSYPQLNTTTTPINCSTIHFHNRTTFNFKMATKRKVLAEASEASWGIEGGDGTNGLDDILLSFDDILPSSLDNILPIPVNDSINSTTGAKLPDIRVLRSNHDINISPMPFCSPSAVMTKAAAAGAIGQHSLAEVNISPMPFTSAWVRATQPEQLTPPFLQVDTSVNAEALVPGLKKTGSDQFYQGSPSVVSASSSSNSSANGSVANAAVAQSVASLSPSEEAATAAADVELPVASDALTPSLSEALTFLADLFSSNGPTPPPQGGVQRFFPSIDGPQQPADTEDFIGDQIPSVPTPIPVTTIAPVLDGHPPYVSSEQSLVTMSTSPLKIQPEQLCYHHDKDCEENLPPDSEDNEDCDMPKDPMNKMRDGSKAEYLKREIAEKESNAINPIVVVHRRPCTHERPIVDIPPFPVDIPTFSVNIPTSPVDIPTLPVEIEPKQVGKRVAAQDEQGARKKAKKQIYWDDNKDNTLRQAVQKESKPTDWKLLSQTYFPDLGTHTQIRNRWQQHLAPGLNNSEFADEEDIVIRQLVAKGLRWGEIAKTLPGRATTEVKERWTNTLLPEVKTGPWSEYESK